MGLPIPFPVEQAVGVEFRDKTLLQRAFIHRSYLNELLDSHEDVTDNERLEFLGDSVLSYIVSEKLYHLFPDHQEGDLTNLRSALVRRETLARLAEELHLGEYLLLGHGEEESGGRQRPATLCATLEALIGAIYLDQGTEVVQRVIFHLFKQEITTLLQTQHTKDPKSRLQEWAQAAIGFTPRYKVVQSLGPDHAKHFVMLVTINGEPHGVGEGRSKQEAAQHAAAHALQRADLPSAEYVTNSDLEQRFGLLNAGHESPPSV